MGKHLSFWIGFFAAALLVVPIAAGIMGVAEERLRQVAVVLFAAVSVLVVLLVIALFFRDRILRRVLGRSETALEDVAGSLVGAVAAASEGDRDKAAMHARALVQGGVGWYTWSSFYRWVIGSALGLLLAFGAFVGTVLLFEQTRTLRIQTERISEQTELMSAQTALMEAQTERLREQSEQAELQNEIMTLNLVNQLREQMLVTIQSGSAVDQLVRRGYLHADEGLVRTENAECSLSFNRAHVLHSPPSETTLRVLEDLSRNESIGDRVREALVFLSEDENGGVAFGAAMVLDRLGALGETSELSFRSVFLALTSQFYRFNTARTFDFTDSVVDGLSCYPQACEVQSFGSFVEFRALHNATGHFNIILTRSRGTNRSNEYVSAAYADAVMESDEVPSDHGRYEDAALIRSDRDTNLIGLGVLRDHEVFLKGTSNPVCLALQNIGRAEKLFTYKD